MSTSDVMSDDGPQRSGGDGALVDSTNDDDDDEIASCIGVAAARARGGGPIRPGGVVAGAERASKRRRPDADSSAAARLSRDEPTVVLDESSEARAQPPLPAGKNAQGTDEPSIVDTDGRQLAAAMALCHPLSPMPVASAE